MDTESNKKISVGRIVRIAATSVVFLVIGLFMMGFGWPTQEAVAQELFKNPASAEVYVKDTSTDQINKMASLIPEGTEATVDGVNKSINSSTVYVTGKTPQGGELTYEVSMLRDMLGWKVVDVKWYHPSVESA